LANIINGTDTGSGGLITTGDSSDELQLQTAEVARVTLTNTAVVVNESGADVDFRVEGDTDANLLFVDAGNDRVGIGTSTPTSKLEVYTGTGAFNAVQAQFNASNTPIVFACNNSNGDAYLGHNTVQVSGTDGQTYAVTNAAAKIRMNGGNFQFNIAPSGTAGNPITFTQAMTLDASGNLLVGKTATSFSTAGTVLYPNGTADFIANGDVAIDINRLVDDGALIRFYQAGTTVGSIGTTGGELYIDFGGSTGGAVTSRTLDDYEEGTFTPTAYGADTTGTTTYGDRSGRYTKIGRQVTAVVYLTVTNMTGTGVLIIGGLPFTSGDASYVGSIMTYNLDWPNAGSCVFYVGDSRTFAYIYISQDNGVWSQPNVDTSFTIFANITYFTS
jgi:hypothetical protein